MRKLVTVREISEIRPIPDADAIVCAVVDGWTVVTKKGEFKPGDLCVFFEIDSFLPESDFRYHFLMHSKITWNGHVGARLKTIRLRKQLSQGLALPLAAFPEVAQIYNDIPSDQDFTDMLDVLKWEPVIPANLAGTIRGNFPTVVPKTDQERIQNIWRYIDHDEVYELTTKLEGSSMTVANIDGDIHVCSRNLSIKLDDEGNAFIRTAKQTAIDVVSKYENIVLQGELMGPGVQGNIEGLTELDFYVFDIYDIKQGRYLNPTERIDLMLTDDFSGLKHVPIIGYHSLNQLGLDTMDKVLDYADGPSIAAKYREGVVFKSMSRGFSWKAISNKYLLKG